MRPALAAILAASILAGCTTGAPVPDGPTPAPPAEASARLVLVAGAFTQPVLALQVPGDDALLVVEQGGRVLRQPLDGGARTVWLDLAERVRAGGERGLLGLALEPGFAEAGRVYVSYTDLAGDSVLARLGATRLVAEKATAETLLTVPQPYANHNGGHLAWGPDGMLYWGLGDGGAGGDPQGNGQDPRALLGSLLRLDVAPATGYAIPPGNPYPDGKAGAREVFAKGLRNPWRFSFDRQTGDLWIGDVGQNAWEEIDKLAATEPGGANFGWNAFEGTRAYDRFGPDAAPFSTHTPPVHEYPTSEGCAVTGGFVYRGAALTALRGKYLYSDYCHGKVYTLDASDPSKPRRLLLETGLQVSSFGEDAAGELYVLHHGGEVWRIAPT